MFEKDKKVFIEGVAQLNDKFFNKLGVEILGPPVKTDFTLIKPLSLDNAMTYTLAANVSNNGFTSENYNIGKLTVKGKTDGLAHILKVQSVGSDVNFNCANIDLNKHSSNGNCQVVLKNADLANIFNDGIGQANKIKYINGIIDQTRHLGKNMGKSNFTIINDDSRKNIIFLTIT